MKRHVWLAMVLAAVTVPTVRGDVVIPPGLGCSICELPVSKDFSLPYKGAKLFFACPGCQAEFEADPKEYTEEANLQLVLTKQVKQVACPLTGKAVDGQRIAKVHNVPVAVCCPQCLDKLKKARKAQRKQLVFGNTGFDRAFKVPTAKKDAERKSRPD